MYDYNNNKAGAEKHQIYKNSKDGISEIQIKKQRYFKRLFGFLLFALVGFSGYLLDQSPTSVSIENALLALGVTWVGFLPSLLYLLDRNRPPMPFFPLVGLFYATSFGLPVFASEEEKVTSLWSLANVNSTALILVLLGVGGAIATYYASKSFLWHKVSPIRLPGPYRLSKLLTLLWVLLLLHLAFVYIPLMQKLPSIGQLLDPIGYISYGLFYIIWSRGKLPAIQTWILLGVCVPLEMIERFSSGSLSEIMLLGLFMVIVIWYEQQRLPVILICITLVFFFTFNSVKAEYRSLVWFEGKNSNLNAVEKVQLFIDLAVKKYQTPENKSRDKSSLNSATDSAISRAAYIVLFSQVVKDTPAKVPYWDGKTYLPLLTSYIPRALFPDKPSENTGNEFGRRYKYLGRNDFSTSWNLPWIVEMYVNFGNWGVLLGMPLVGLFLAFLEQKLNQSGMNPLEFVIGATVLFALFYQESNLSLMTGSIINLTLALLVLFKLFLGNHSRRSA